MVWFHQIGAFEYIIIGVAILAYILYLWRVISAANRLGLSSGRTLPKILLRGVYIALFLVALLGPSWGESTREVKAVGKDIFFCIDMSQSMNANDVQPTRLEKVKFELKRLIDAFSSDRIGIIIFSGEAFMQCPLTFDQGALNLFLETLHTGLVPNAGTDFGPPLSLAAEKFQQNPEVAGKKSSQIIVLISDGEDFGEDTDEATKEVKDADIKLFTLGVGTESGSKIRGAEGFKRDRKGNEVVTHLSSESLQKLARNTGGEYFEINETKNDVSRLINTINGIEGELMDSRQIDSSANKYYYFLALGLLLLAIDLLFKIKVLKI